jgi:hypothetical protein
MKHGFDSRTGYQNRLKTLVNHIFARVFYLTGGYIGGLFRLKSIYMKAALELCSKKK